MQLTYWKVALPFEYPFTISGNRSKTEQPALVVCLSEQGLDGYGEAPAIRYYQVEPDVLAAALEEKREVIEATALKHPQTLYALWLELFAEHPFLVCALDMATWDWYGKSKQQTVAQLMGALSHAQVPSTDYTLGIDAPAVMLEKMRARPWPVYKVKVGFNGDLELIDELLANSQSRFRLDANGGWSESEALDKLHKLNKQRIEFVEQPIAPEQTQAQRMLFEQSPLPLLADESCVSEADVDRCAGLFHGINIKLTKCGGITPARRMIERARLLGLQVMMGSMNESSIGTAAIAAFVGLLDHVDMDGPLLLRGDYARGLQLLPQQTIVEGSSGLGVTVYRDQLTKHRIEPNRSRSGLV